MKVTLSNVPRVEPEVQTELGRSFCMLLVAAGVNVNDVRVEWED